MKLVDSVRHLIACGRHVLLVYDGYGAHIALCVLELFKRSRVVAYALPSHTNGSMQQLFVVAFAELKRELRNAQARLLET